MLGAHLAVNIALGLVASTLSRAPVVIGDKAVVDALGTLLAREVDIDNVAPLVEVLYDVFLCDLVWHASNIEPGAAAVCTG